MKDDTRPLPKKESPTSQLAQTRIKVFLAFLALIVSLLLVFAVFLFLTYPASHHPGTQQQSSQVAKELLPLLPGQQLWKDDVSSFLFGTNDTQEWVSNNVETNRSIQQALKDAHFTLMRTFFFDRSLLDGHPTTDAEINQRLQTIENSHMICLGVLEPYDNAAFIEHVVTYAGRRCILYEFGNEPDQQGMQQYILAWNRLIPELRKINPAAKFIGPVVADYMQVRPFLTAVKASGVLPDAISFHWYPCGSSDSASLCLARASTFAGVTTQVKAWVRSILGQNLPVGITEWNYNADNPPTAYRGDPTFITQFTSSALHFMIQARLDFANQFDAASGAGSGGLDMFDFYTGRPKLQYIALRNLVNQYRPAGSS
jgi:hypothetical protein